MAAHQAPPSLGFSGQKYWSGLPLPPPVDHVLSELSTMTRPSWVALHSMAHSFNELDAGQDWRQEEKGTTEDEMVGWHHLLDGHEFEQALGVGDVQGSPACCSPWGYKESDTTEQLRWTEIDPIIKFYSHLSCLFPILPSRIRPSITHMSSAKLNRIRSKKQLWSYCKGNTYGLCLLLVSILKYPQTIILRNQTS